MRKMIVLMALAFAICWAAASCGSSSDVCEEAGEKIADCLKNMDCSKLDAMLQPTCEEMKKGGTGTGTTTTEAPKCEGQVEAAAQAIVDCAELDESQFCAKCK